jgi:hypothetical protein
MMKHDDDKLIDLQKFHETSAGNLQFTVVRKHETPA